MHPYTTGFWPRTWQALQPLLCNMHKLCARGGNDNDDRNDIDGVGGGVGVGDDDGGGIGVGDDCGGGDDDDGGRVAHCAKRARCV